MQVRRLDDNWDYCFGRGSQNYISGIEAVGQAIKQRLLLLYVDIIIRDRISGTEGVQSVTFFESNYERRHYKFTATVETIYGSLTISSEEVQM